MKRFLEWLLHNIGLEGTKQSFHPDCVIFHDGKDMDAEYGHNHYTHEAVYWLSDDPNNYIPASSAICLYHKDDAEHNWRLPPAALPPRGG